MAAASKPTYPIEQCALYKLRSKRRLGSLLNETPATLQALARVGDDNYSRYLINPPGKKARWVQHPKPHLERIHRRLFALLQRVHAPDYLFSGVKGRSYIDNARQHLGWHPVATIDIKAFYPSTYAPKLYRVFRELLLCSPDVSGLLTRLCTCSGHIPTGSSISQLLAFYANKQLFDEVAAISRKQEVTMTCYVDDLTFSGTQVSGKFLWEVKKAIHRNGLVYHKERRYPLQSAKKITGVIVRGFEIAVPNKLQKAIWEGVEGKSENVTRATLVGKCNAAAQIDPRFAQKARALRKVHKKPTVR